jgi:CBS domain containing-hemolysin-like protein
MEVPMLGEGDGYVLAAAVLLLLVAAYFNAAREAMTRMTPYRALKLHKEEVRGASRLVALMRNPARTLNILALVVVLAQVSAVALVAIVADHILDGGLAFAAALLVGAIALFVVADVVPRTIGVQHTDGVAVRTARWVGLLAGPLSPFAWLLIRLGNVIAPGKGLAAGPFVTEEAVREMIDVAESDSVIEAGERAMIHSIFELGDTLVREIMVPRPDMVMVSSDAKLDEVVDTLLSAGYTRLPVYKGDRDTIIGLVYAKDILKLLSMPDQAEGAWQQLLRRPYFVPELKPVDKLLRELQARQVHMAVVVDEYGTTAGLVTIEDILEEIVGEIVDEYDREESLVEQIDEDRWRVDARLPVDDLDEIVDTHLPDEEWDTVGGLLFGLLGHVPKPGEQVEVDALRLIAEHVKGRRIATVLVERAAPTPAAEAAAAE